MKYADLILFSNAVFDSVKDEPYNGGVAISGDKIMFAGSRTDVEKFIGPDTTVKDYGDSTITAGFCDGHAHLDGSSQKEYAEIVTGLDNCRNEAECIAIVVDFVKAHPHLKRIFGTNWVLTSWLPVPQPPTRHSLDAVFPDIPVYLLGADGHTIWINTKAMEECDLESIVAAHPEFPSEWATRDENGELTGYLSEMFCHMVHSFAEKYTQEQREEFQEKYVKMLPSLGLTGFTDVSMMPAAGIPAYFRKLKELENNGELPIRVYSWAGIGPAKGSDDVSDAEQVKLMSTYMNTDRLRIAGIKSLIDGIPFSYTAALLEPYADNPSTKGEFLNGSNIFKRWTAKVNALGFGVKYHCTGDAAVRLALDCFEESAMEQDTTGLKNAVEHMDCIEQDDINRYKKVHAIASMQPAHLVMCKGIHYIREGKERGLREWAFRRIINAGATISVGTDSPVVDINPYYTIYKAVTRLDLDGTSYSPGTMDQALTVAEVIRGYTWGSAYASNMEEKVGTLEVGKYADIVVTDKNMFAIPPTELKDCRAVLTVSGGKIVYEA